MASNHAQIPATYFFSQLKQRAYLFQVKANIRNPLRYLSGSVKKSVDLTPKITLRKKWLKMGKNWTLGNRDRPTFFKKTLQKWWGWGIMAITNGVNAVVVPCLWGIETEPVGNEKILHPQPMLYLPYEGLTLVFAGTCAFLFASYLKLYLPYEKY